MLEVGIWILLLSILLPAVYFDVRFRRIPNLISLSGWILAPLFYAIIQGQEAMINSLFGLAALLVISFPLYMVGWMGAGDVKLIASVGAIVGIGQAFFLLFGILATGMAASLVVLVVNRRMGEILTGFYVAGIINGFRLMLSKANSAESGFALPYALPIAIGSVTTLLVVGNG